MSDAQHDDEDGAPQGPVTEIQLLKQRATMMGIPFSNNIGVETLRSKIAAKMGDDYEMPTAPAPAPAPVQEPPSLVPPVNPLEDPRDAAARERISARHLGPKERKIALRDELRRKHLRLVRVRIQNLDPKKKDLHGEIFTMGNEVLGTISKFVPYGEVTDEGYHLPYCMYRMLDQRRFVNITVTRDRRTGKETVRTNMAKEFAFEVLPQLTPAQLSQLAAAQAAAGSVE